MRHITCSRKDKHRFMEEATHDKAGAVSVQVSRDETRLQMAPGCVLSAHDIVHVDVVRGIDCGWVAWLSRLHLLLEGSLGPSR